MDAFIGIMSLLVVFLARLPPDGALPDLGPDAGRHLPHTEAVAERVMLLPTGTAVSATIRSICEMFRCKVTRIMTMFSLSGVMPRLYWGRQMEGLASCDGSHYG